MLFYSKRFERARDLQRRQRGLDDADEEKSGVEKDGVEAVAPAEAIETEEVEKVDLKKLSRKERKKFKAQGTLAAETEKGDVGAMMLSGFLTLFLPAAAILIALAALVCWIFGLF